MRATRAVFPSTERLRNGAILTTIAHALWVVANPTFAYELSWDGKNYNRNNSQGARGTVTFAEEGVVGLFYDLHSERSPYRHNASFDMQKYLAPMPAHLRVIAQQETMWYLVDEYQGNKIPVVTTAFWSIGNVLTAAETWEEVTKHGAHVVRLETIDEQTAMAELVRNYVFSATQIGAIRSVYLHRINSRNLPLAVKQNEIESFLVNGRAGIDDCMELLASIGIALER